MKNVVEIIQMNNPSYDPLGEALTASGVSMDTWNAAGSRIYYDGYFGPLSDEDWKEQDGREPSNVKEAIAVVAKVLDKVESYYEFDFCEPGSTHTNCTGHRIWNTEVHSSEIKQALIPFYKEIYGEKYPSV